jgi:enoyl-CoA hydratase/carnithine racemase
MIQTEKSTGIVTLTLARPERRNALSHAGIKALVAALADAEADSGCRCVIVTGAGGHFCSGRDLAEAKEGAPLEEILRYDEDWTDIFHLLRGLSKPTIAMVAGNAVAGGFTLAMGCDFVVAERSARFGALEMRGNFPAAVNAMILTHFTGHRQSLELLLSADTFSAEHLYRLGLVNRLAEDAAGLAAETRAWAEKLAALDATAVRLTKDAVRMGLSMPLSEALVAGRQLNSLLMATGRVAAAARLRERR